MLCWTGWIDDGVFMQKDACVSGFGGDKRGDGSRRNILWNNFGSHHAFTTGRQRMTETNFGNKVRPKGPSQTLKVSDGDLTTVIVYAFAYEKVFSFSSQQPGKLNLKNFAIVNEAIARMNVNSDNMPEGDQKKLGVNNKGSMFYDHAPLAAPEDDSDDLAEYAQVKDVYGNEGVGSGGVGIGGGGPNEQNMYTFPHDTTPNKSKIRHRRDNNKSLQSNI